MHGRHAELLETIEMSGSQRLAAAICESGVRARDAAFLGSAWASSSPSGPASRARPGGAK